MAVPAIGQKYLMTFVGHLSGQTVMSTFWYVLDNIGVFTNVISLYAAIKDVVDDAGNLRDKYIACCPTDYILEQIWLQLIKPERIMKSVFTDGAPGTDQPAGTANVAAVITRRGEPATRNAVSTLHVPLAPTEDNMTLGQLAPTGVKTKLSLLAAQMLLPLEGGALAGAKLTPIVYQPRTGLPVNGHAIVRANVEGTVRVMRRRTVGLGI